MQVSFINTDNLKFSVAFALEKSLLAAKEQSRHSMLCFFGPENEYISVLSELGWLRLLSHSATDKSEEASQIFALAQEFISFQFTTSVIAIAENVHSLYLIAPSKVLPTSSTYMQLILQLQGAKVAQVIFFDSLKHFVFQECYSPLQYVPSSSLANCIEHPSSSQYEIQQLSTKNILETVTVLRSQNDRFKFERQYLLSSNNKM